MGDRWKHGWDEVTEAKLLALWHGEISAAQIGLALGMSKNAIVGKAHRLGLPARPSPIRRGAETSTAAPRKKCGALESANNVRKLLGGFAPAEMVAPALPVDSPKHVRRPASPASAVSSKPCCWPLGDPRAPGFRFCGNPALPVRPYCPAHHAVAYAGTVFRRDDAA